MSKERRDVLGKKGNFTEFQKQYPAAVQDITKRGWTKVSHLLPATSPDGMFFAVQLSEFTPETGAEAIIYDPQKIAVFAVGVTDMTPTNTLIEIESAHVQQGWHILHRQLKPPSANHKSIIIPTQRLVMIRKYNNYVFPR